jgi:hypothetical protein
MQSLIKIQTPSTTTATAHAYYTLINKKELNRSVQFDFIFVKIEQA